MFRLGTSFKFYCAVLGAFIVALCAAQLSYSESINRQSAQFVPIINTVIHSPVSHAQFEKLVRKRVIGTRRIIIFSDRANTELTDTVVQQLRRKINDPRLTTQWNWSQNWERLRNTSEGSCLLFKRAGKLAIPEQHSSVQDYYEGWVNCSAPSTAVLRLICKATSDDCLIFKSSGDSITEEQLQPGGWRLFEWTTTAPIQLTFRSTSSPEIGVLATEPVQGFSIWQLPAPECIDHSMREQAALLAPQLVIIISRDQEAATLVHKIKRLFREIPVLMCCNEVSQKQQLAFTRSLLKQNAALYHFSAATSFTNRAASLTSLIEKLAGITP